MELKNAINTCNNSSIYSYIKMKRKVETTTEFVERIRLSQKGTVKIVNDGLYFIFLFSLYFTLLYFFLFNFLFLEQLRLGFISHAVTSVTNWWHSHRTDHRTWKNEVEGSGTKWCHTAWTTHAGLMLYSWSFRVGCTVVSMDHE